jgi:hypothetical protein
MNPLPTETLGEVARHTVEGFVESQQALVNLMFSAGQPSHKAHAAAEHPKPGRKRAVAARRKSVAETA